MRTVIIAPASVLRCAVESVNSAVVVYVGDNVTRIENPLKPAFSSGPHVTIEEIDVRLRTTGHNREEDVDEAVSIAASARGVHTLAGK